MCGLIVWVAHGASETCASASRASFPSRAKKAHDVKGKPTLLVLEARDGSLGESPPQRSVRAALGDVAITPRKDINMRRVTLSRRS